MNFQNGCIKVPGPERVSALAPEMIDRWARERGYAVTLAETGARILDFPYDDEIGCCFRCTILAGLPDIPGLHARGSSTAYFEGADRSKLLDLMNGFQLENLWPNLSLRQDDGQLSVDTCLYMNIRDEVAFDLLRDILDCFLSSTYAFYKYLKAS